jgi:hypothetical protein
MAIIFMNMRWEGRMACKGEIANTTFRFKNI